MGQKTGQKRVENGPKTGRKRAEKQVANAEICLQNALLLHYFGIL